jgi:uncharacterized protein (TIGR02217 family)
MAFIESPRFPDNISYGSVGGPKYNTTLVISDSGQEYANINWENSRHEFNVAMGVRSMSELSDLIRFFHLCRGRAHQFRYKNWLDYKSCDVEDNITPYDQVFGVGDGVESEFQLIKRYELYGISSLTLEYIIKKPVPNTVIVAINNNIKTINVDYVVDTTTGIVTFTTIPSVGDVLTWGGEFDLPCRFDVDELQISLDFFEHGSTNIPLIEVRLE